MGNEDYMTRLTYLLFLIGIALVVVTAPVAAQQPEYLWSIEESMFRGTSIGEDYTLEMTGGMWNPTPSIVVSSEQFGIIGSEINFGDDLGMVRKRHPEMRLTYKPGRRHKLRLDWLPMQYNQSAVLERRVVFQGIAFDAGVGVDSAIRWDTWRFGYEFDLIARERGYVGLILEAKYTHIQAELNSDIGNEYVKARAPIPAVGAITRVYVTRFTPITAEFTAFRLPDNVVDGYEARYVDFDVYGTINLSRMVGINLGYRSMDMSYLVERDTGDLKLEGMYLSGAFRF
jgi:hypothetical protein